MDFTGDASEDEVFEVELQWENRSSVGDRNKERQVKQGVMEQLRGKLNNKLLQWVKEFRAMK